MKCQVIINYWTPVIQYCLSMSDSIWSETIANTLKQDCLKEQEGLHSTQSKRMTK